MYQSFENCAVDDLRLKVNEKYNFETQAPFLGQIIEI